MRNALKIAFCCIGMLVLVVGPLFGQETSLCGDANGDRTVNIGDAVFIINYVFRSGPEPIPTCCDACLAGETRPCYTGPPATEGIGQCLAGIQSCVDGAWGPCEGEVTPVQEDCNGRDDDCDDFTDNNLSPPPCELAQGVCAGALKNCGGEMGWLPCEAVDYGPDYELEENLCDGLDNDCDGQEDEMCAGMPHVTTYGCDADTCIVDVCVSGWADCNGVFSDGCEVDLSQAPNTCMTGYFLGSYPGDENTGCGGTDVQFNDRGENYYRVNMIEDCSDSPFSGTPVGIRATLYVPAGIDYDLYLYRENCTLIAQSTNTGSQTEYVQHFVDDVYGEDNSITYRIEIRFYSGTSCADWTLRIQSYND